MNKVSCQDEFLHVAVMFLFDEIFCGTLDILIMIKRVLNKFNQMDIPHYTQNSFLPPQKTGFDFELNLNRRLLV